VPVKPCLTCGMPTRNGSRCAPHAAQHAAMQERRRQRPNANARGYDRAYRKRRAVVVRGTPPCFYCGRPATTADHVVPVSKGGGSAANLVPACKPCNSRKGNRS
jgi:5-methylcytosine-specific restriction endonuclease McrA